MEEILENGFKICRFCAENVREEAIKCRYCGESLEEESFWEESDRKRGGIQSRIPSKPILNPGTAAVLSLFFPGAGQIYRGKLAKGIFWFICVVIGYFLFVFPGLVLHGICIFNAYDSE
jgi:hypothetical protein